MDETEQNTIDAAQQQAKFDNPSYDHYRGKIIATEVDRSLVAVFMNRDDGRLRPSPVVLYAVSLDCKTACLVASTDGAPYGFHPERRRYVALPMFRFTIRDVLWLMVVAGRSAGIKCR